MPGRDFGGEVDLAEPAAGEDGAVDELLEGDSGEGGVSGGLGGAAGGLERGAEVPAVGDDDGWGEQDVGGFGVLDVGGEGVDEESVPAEEGEVGAGGAAFGEVGAAGGKEVHFDVELGGVGRDGDVVAVHVNQVALPLDGLAGGRGDDEARLVDEGSGGAVLAWDPLRVDEGEEAGLDGDDFGGVEDFAGSVGEVDGEGDGCGLSGYGKGGGAEGGQGDEARQHVVSS